MMLHGLLGYLMCNILLAWATLQQPYFSRTLSAPPPKILINGHILLYLNHNLNI